MKMQPINLKKYLIPLSVVFIIIGLYAIFVFILRPNIVREICDERSLHISVLLYPADVYPDTAERVSLQNNEYEKQYSTCIGLRGLKK